MDQCRNGFYRYRNYCLGIIVRKVFTIIAQTGEEEYGMISETMDELLPLGGILKRSNEEMEANSNN